MYDLANRLTTSISGAALTSYTFDPNGNNTVVLTTGAVTMAYDKENRLVNYLSSAAAASYTYSGDGLKRSEWNAGIPTTLVWNGQDYLQGRQ